MSDRPGRFEAVPYDLLACFVRAYAPLVNWADTVHARLDACIDWREEARVGEILDDEAFLTSDQRVLFETAFPVSAHHHTSAPGARAPHRTHARRVCEPTAPRVSAALARPKLHRPCTGPHRQAHPSLPLHPPFALVAHTLPAPLRPLCHLHSSSAPPPLPLFRLAHYVAVGYASRALCGREEREARALREGGERGAHL